MAHLVRSVDPLGVVSEYSYDELRLTEKLTMKVRTYCPGDGCAGHVIQANMTISAASGRCCHRMRGQGSQAMRQQKNLVSQRNALGERAEFFWDALNRPVRLQWTECCGRWSCAGSGYGWASNGGYRRGV